MRETVRHDHEVRFHVGNSWNSGHVSEFISENKPNLYQPHYACVTIMTAT
jgi:hypothetical protein